MKFYQLRRRRPAAPRPRPHAASETEKGDVQMAEIIITADNFQQEVLNSPIPVLVDFWATWCGPCKMVAPVVAEIAEELAGVVKVAKVDVDDNRELAIEYGISSIPTLMVFKNGEPVKAAVGVRPKAAILSMLK
jgi:thioredoxin 1